MWSLIVGLIFKLFGLQSEEDVRKELAKEREKRISTEADLAGTKKRIELNEENRKEQEVLDEAKEKGDTDTQFDTLKRDFDD